MDVDEPVNLSMDTINKLPANVFVPKYGRTGKENAPDFYICHIGVGGFFRSHQCEYMDDLLNKNAAMQEGNGDARKRWGYCGIGLMEVKYKS